MPELQAARGASLSTSEVLPKPTGAAPDGSRHGSHTEVKAPSGRSATRLVFAVGSVALLVDVLSKRIAVRELTGREPVEVLGDFLQLRLVLNPGMAFGAGGSSLTPVISVVAIIATLVTVYFALRVRNRSWAVGLGLLLAGVGGNLVDRMFREPGPFRGHVVDFFALPHWPVFNVADICIDAAAFLFAVLLIRGVRLDGTRPAHDARRDEE